MKKFYKIYTLKSGILLCFIFIFANSISGQDKIRYQGERSICFDFWTTDYYSELLLDNRNHTFRLNVVVNKGTIPISVDSSIASGKYKFSKSQTLTLTLKQKKKFPKKIIYQIQGDSLVLAKAYKNYLLFTLHKLK